MGNEDYIYNPNDELTAHCVVNNCYDDKNNLIYMRNENLDSK